MTDDIDTDETERETVLMAVKKKWIENDHVHIELFAPANRFERGVPEECAILEMLPGESRDWSLHEDTEEP